MVGKVVLSWNMGVRACVDAYPFSTLVLVSVVDVVVVSQVQS